MKTWQKELLKTIDNEIDYFKDFYVLYRRKWAESIKLKEKIKKEMKNPADVSASAGQVDETSKRTTTI